MDKILIYPKPQSVKRFYFFEYFLVLLKSVKAHSKEDDIFDYFMSLKHDFQLGESKYKKLSLGDQVSPPKMARYRYTFNQVLNESFEYKLIRRRGRSKEVLLTQIGEEALSHAETGNMLEFNKFLFKYMEAKYHAFYYLINTCYEANPDKAGLLIFPIYSPSTLGFKRNTIRTSGDLIDYLYSLQSKLEQDIQLHLSKSVSLNDSNSNLIKRLKDVNLIPSEPSGKFDDEKFNAIVKRVRDYWLSYFLKELYNYQYSRISFEIWAYRGKQVGVLHATEFYPNFNGKVVYPLSLTANETSSKDFKNIFEYRNGERLYIHEPSWNEAREKFIDSLFNAYFDIRETARSYFINLVNVREIVCYNMKIPEYLFDEFLGNAYRLSLNEKLRRIRISLEVDKLPEETNAIYLKRSPVMVDGRYRNIIAIDRIT